MYTAQNMEEDISNLNKENVRIKQENRVSFQRRFGKTF